LRRNKLLHKNQKGFTLSELMVVMVLIGIMVSFTYTVFNMSINQYFELQRDGDAFYSLSQHYQRLANVLRGSTGITNAASSDLTVYAYFSPNDSTVSQIRYYISGTSMMADITPMTANPPGGTPLTAQKKTYTIIPNFYSAPGVDTFVYLDAANTVLTPPISDLNTIKAIKINLAVSSVKPSISHQALTIQISLRNRKTNL